MLLNEMHLDQVRRDREREIRNRMRDRRVRRQVESRTVRRAIGRSIIEIGHRIAAEPQTSRSPTASAPRLARSR